MAVAAKPKAPPKAAKPPKAPQPRTGYRAKQQNVKYLRANGNMSVERREQIIVPALEKLGYSRQDAEDIALDAPLNSIYTQQRALAAALQYAASITPQNAKASGGPTVQSALATKQIAMPTAAQSAYDALQTGQQNPVQRATSRSRFIGSGLKRILDRASDAVKPWSDRVANTSVPGGLGSLFMLNLLFLFFAVPAGPPGYTRAQLLWLTLMNRTRLKQEATPSTVPDSGIVDAMLAIAGGIEDIAGVFGGPGKLAGSVGDLIGSILGNLGNTFGGTDMQASILNQMTQQLKSQLPASVWNQIVSTCGQPKDLSQYNAGNKTLYVTDQTKWLTCVQTNYGNSSATKPQSNTNSGAPSQSTVIQAATGPSAPPPSNVVTRTL